MNILMSIKPRYIKQMKNGEKKFEFRKSFVNGDKVEKIYVYATYPEKKIIGYLDFEYVVELPIKELYDFCKKEWEELPTELFNSYFKYKRFGCAIKVKNLIEFDKAINPYELDTFAPPQSYYVMDEELTDFVLEKL